MLMCVRKMFGKCSTIWPKCPSLYQKSLSFNIHVYSDLKFRLHTTERGRFLRLQNIPPTSEKGCAATVQSIPVEASEGFPSHKMENEWICSLKFTSTSISQRVSRSNGHGTSYSQAYKNVMDNSGIKSSKGKHDDLGRYQNKQTKKWNT